MARSTLCLARDACVMADEWKVCSKRKTCQMVGNRPFGTLHFLLDVRLTGIEPARRETLDPKSSASANSATGASGMQRYTNIFQTLYKLKRNYQIILIYDWNLGVSLL